DQFNDFIAWLKQSNEQVLLASDGVVSFVEKETDAAAKTGDLGKAAAATGADLIKFGIDAKDAGELAAKGIAAAANAMPKITAQTEFTEGWDKLNETLIKIAPSFSNIGSAASDMGEKTDTALSKTFEQTLKAQEQANNFELEWVKLEQQDRELVFKLQADIAIAQIQQGTELVKAAFESINEGIKSTGDLLGQLAKDFTDVSSGAKASELERLLENEDKRRQQEFELQKDLEQAQIQYLNAVTD